MAVTPATKVVLLDKDGTLLEDVPYNVDPRRIRLTAGAEEGLEMLRAAGYRIAVVTNQGGVARGLFPETSLAAVEARIRELLAALGVPLAGFYYCPHDPRGTVAPFNRRCRCRKPAPGLIKKASRELGFAPRSAWVLGDILDDVEAGRRAGCKTILVDRGSETEWRMNRARMPHHVAADLAEAAAIIVRMDERRVGPWEDRSPQAPEAEGRTLEDRAVDSKTRLRGRLRSLEKRLRMEKRSGEWSDVRRVLCVRLDAMGDVLMTTPAMHAIKTSAPQANVVLLTSPAGAEAGRLVPDLNDLMIYEAPWVKASGWRRTSQPDHDMIERLREQRFDAAVIFTVYSQNPLPAALLCFLAEVPRRLAHCRENPYQLLTHWIPDPEPAGRLRHEVRRQLDLVASVGWRAEDERLRVKVPSAAERRIDELLADAGIDAHRRWLVLHPGASAPSRRYPAARYAAVIRSLVDTHGWQVVLTGGEAESVLVEAIRLEAAVPAVSLAGRIDLGELAALLARAPILVSNNTGPVHVAAAVGTPVVDLYALTNPQHTPWHVASRVLYHDVPCRCCYKSVCPAGHHACLLGVTPERVVEAVLELWSERPGRRMLPRGECLAGLLPVAAGHEP